MKKGLAIIILTIISTANLTANDILTLFSKWENASKIDRIHIGNELLEKGTEEGLLMGKYTYGRNQAIESEARIYDMMSCYYYIKNQFDDALSMALMALPLCEKSNDDNLLADCINNIGILYQRKGLFGQAINYMERVYKLDLKAKDKQGMSSTMNNLATLYLATGQAENSIGIYSSGDRDGARTRRPGEAGDPSGTGFGHLAGDGSQRQSPGLRGRGVQA